MAMFDLSTSKLLPFYHSRSRFTARAVECLLADEIREPVKSVTGYSQRAVATDRTVSALTEVSV